MKRARACFFISMTRMRAFITVVSCFAMLSGCAGPDARPTQTRTRIERAEDLPRHNYPVQTTATDLVLDETQFTTLARRLDADLRADLAAYDIQDRATLKSFYGTLSQIALHRGEVDEALAWQDSIGAVEEKPAKKLLAGLVERSWIEAARGSADRRDEAFRERFRRAVSALPYDQVQAELREMKALFERTYRNMVLGSILVEVEPSAKNGEIPRELAQRLVDTRNALDVWVPVRDVAIETLRETIAAHTVVKPDIWAPRDVSLEDRAGLTPVIIGIWDTGLDVTVYPDRLFVNAREKPGNGRDDDGNGFVDDVHGIAYDLQYRKTTDLLAQLSFDTEREATYRRLSQGFTDLRAGRDSPEAAELRGVLGSIAVDEFVSFYEGFFEYFDYSHGTVVAGIAAAGNPAARILAVRETYDFYQSVPQLPTLELVEAEARKFREIVAYLRDSGARVVNMSWAFGARDYESVLEINNAGGDAEERRALGRRMFDISAGALREAIASAPNILFVAAAGNEDADNRFTTSVPASFDLPNVITVAAVDQAGDEASFTSYGKADVYANGVDVPSHVPGGDEQRGYGTSVAAPQVASLAGKLLAVRPDLDVARLRDLILSGTDGKAIGPGKQIRLLNPKRSLELLAGR